MIAAAEDRAPASAGLAPAFAAVRARIGQYFFEGWDEGHVGYADIARNRDGSYAISSTGLAGTGTARLDAQGRLASYSGQGTTYKQEVRRITDGPDIDAMRADRLFRRDVIGRAHDRAFFGQGSALPPLSFAMPHAGQAEI